jgi:hypothetical protein
MALTYQNSDGTPAGCYPAADVVGTTLTYSADASAPNSLASVTVAFGAHTDGGGVRRDGVVKITCVKGGPTSDFVYTAAPLRNPDGHQYEISTTADCQHSGSTPSPTPPSPPPPSQGYACLSGDCLMVENVTGVPLDVCQEMCLQKYECVHGMCVVNNCSRGVPLPVCKDVCV